MADLPAGWTLAILDPSLAHMMSGFACARSKAVTNGLPHLRPFNVDQKGNVDLSELIHIPEDFISNAQDYFLEKGDVLFNNTNSVELVGKSAIAREPLVCAFSNHITRLRVVDANRLDPNWLLVYFRQLWVTGYFAANCNRWIGQAGFAASKLAELEIPLPPIETQRRIVKRLESLLAEVTEARGLQEKIEDETGQIIERILLETFDAPHSEWNENTIRNLIRGKPQYGLSTKLSEEPIGLPVLRMGNIKNGKIYLDNLKYVDLPQSEIDKYSLNRGDIVFNRTNSAELVGKTGVVDFDMKVLFASYLIRLQVDETKVKPKFVAYYINSPAGRKYIQEVLTKAIGQVNVNAQKLLDMSILVPPTINEQENIIQYMEAVSKEIEELRLGNRETRNLLIQLEQSFLGQAFRGEL